MSDKQRTIYQKVLDITAELGAVKKGSTNTGQNYKYRSIDDVVNALHPLLAKHKVLVFPKVQSTTTDRFIVEKYDSYSKTSKNQSWTSVKLVMEYVFVDADTGESFTASALGEGLDTGDKASYKAMTGALKYGLSQTLMIPTEEDPDKHDLKSEFVNTNKKADNTPITKISHKQLKDIDTIVNQLAELTVHTTDQLMERLEELYGRKDSWTTVQGTKILKEITEKLEAKKKEVSQ